jgi:hypothetical protein
MFKVNGQTLASHVPVKCQFCDVEQLKGLAMNIDRSEFLGWMQKIMERFDIMMEVMGSKEKNLAAIDGEALLDNQDVLHMLKISSRSLQRYRSSGRLPYYTISGKLYYKLSDVHQFIRESFNPKWHE